MSKLAVAKEALKESLIGHEESVNLSAQTKARFLTHAVADAETGDLYLGPDEFLKAVVPGDEDFVSQPWGESEKYLPLHLYRYNHLDIRSTDLISLATLRPSSPH